MVTSIRVRMYRVGFGDCFLVSFGEDAHVLVDCGVHVRGDLKVLDDVVADIEEETGGTLAAVVASHAHEDHIGGYGRHRDRFARFTIGEVWLPWSEDPTDETAIRLRRRRAELAAALEAYATRHPLSAAANDAVLNAAAVSRNAVALDALRSGFGTGATVRYLAAGTVLHSAAGVPTLGVRALGPPKDEAFLKRMDPPSAQRFLRLGPDRTQPAAAFGTQPATADGGIRPFDDRWQRAGGGPELPAPDLKRLRKASEPPGDALAFTLDQALNNTSLVLLFDFRGRRLLFPGDAQWGGWQSWLEKPEAEELLSTVDFVKIAHHGSENATPREALEAMTKTSLTAMVSTQQKPWPSIPYDKLYAAVEAQTANRVVRSDSLKLTGAPAGPVLPALPAGFEQGRLWFDLHIDAGP